jgi:hypothetical protein
MIERNTTRFSKCGFLMYYCPVNFKIFCSSTSWWRCQSKAASFTHRCRTYPAADSLMTFYFLSMSSSIVGHLTLTIPSYRNVAIHVQTPGFRTQLSFRNMVRLRLWLPIRRMLPQRALRKRMSGGKSRARQLRSRILWKIPRRELWHRQQVLHVRV